MQSKIALEVGVNGRNRYGKKRIYIQGKDNGRAEEAFNQRSSAIADFKTEKNFEKRIYRAAENILKK